MIKTLLRCINLKLKLDNKTTTAIILILIALFSFIFFGFIGFRTIFGILLVFFLPTYLILDNFDLQTSEKLIFAFFLGVGLFSAIVYMLGTIISFKLSIAITFVLVIALSFLLKKVKKK